jgi:hypothetical protein
MRTIEKYWQILASLLSLAVGVGIAVATIRSQAEVTQLVIRRVDRLELNDSSSRVLLERIDERTKNIIDRLDRERK